MKSRFLLFLFLHTLVSAAQSYKGLQVSVLPGFLIAHREYMANMEAHTMGIELMYSSNFTGWKQVDDTYSNLRWGAGFTWFDLGNPKLNGYVYALHGHVEANLIRKERFQSVLRFGSGVGYLDRPYSLENNRKNKAIGSRLNGNMQVMYRAYLDVSRRASLTFGLGVTHYSNGNFRRPNLGINTAHLSLGLLHKFKIYDVPAPSRKLPVLFPERGFEVSFGYARKQIAVADTRFFNIFAGSLLYYFPQTENRNWRLGTDVFYDKTYPYSLFKPETLRNNKPGDVTEIALKAGHEFIFGRIAVVTDLGTYLYRPNDYKKRVYFSIGFNYFINKGWNLQTRLKSHLAVADYFFWSGGYRFSDSFIRKKS